MSNAQRLYEAGLITYMRTDSVNLSDEAKNGAKQEIVSAYGEAYSKSRNYKGKSKSLIPERWTDVIKKNENQ